MVVPVLVSVMSKLNTTKYNQADISSPDLGYILSLVAGAVVPRVSVTPAQFRYQSSFETNFSDQPQLNTSGQVIKLVILIWIILL